VRFFYLVDVIARAFEPTKSQLDAIESAYRGTADFLSQSEEFRAILVQVYPHGSRQLGTMVRPMDRTRTGFDIDLVALLRRQALAEFNPPDGPGRLLGRLHTVLTRYSHAHGLQLRRWERCVTLEYADQMRADIAPVVDDPLLVAPYGETHGRVPDRQLKQYDPTNPRGFARHFAAAASISPSFTKIHAFDEAYDRLRKAEIVPLADSSEVFERLLSRLVQLVKVHRNESFGANGVDADLAPRSIFVTTLVAAAYASVARIPHEGPLELLLDVVASMSRHFSRTPQADGTEHWHLPNPSAPAENLASSMNSPQRQAAFWWWHSRFQAQLEAILDAIEQQAGLDQVLKLIGEAFGAKASSAIADDESARRRAQRGVGRVAMHGALAAPTIATARTHTFYGDR
jgi:hypothetical protein